MRSYPAVSIIIPTKNEEENITRCLKSIKKQSYPGKIEIVVVDNYSRDKTVKFARRYTPDVYIQGAERSSQRNFGAKKAKGKYLLFVDADMELKKGAVSACISLYSNCQSAIALKEHSQGSTFWGKALALEKNCYQDSEILAAARFFKKPNFLKLGGFDEKLIAAEDWDLTERAKKTGLSILITHTPLIIHHEPKESLFKLLSKELYYINNIHYYKKKHSKRFTQQASLKYRTSLWFKHWTKLLPHPLLTLSFLFYKLLVYLLWQINRLLKASH